MLEIDEDDKKNAHSSIMDLEEPPFFNVDDSEDYVIAITGILIYLYLQILTLPLRVYRKGIFFDFT